MVAARRTLDLPAPAPAPFPPRSGVPTRVKAGLWWYRMLSHFESPPQVKGRRLLLRPLVRTDYHAWQEVRARCTEWLARWGLQPLDAPLQNDDRATFAFLCARQARWRRLSTCLAFGIFVDDRFAGEISLNSIERGPYQTASIGYWIDRTLAGQGLAPEAVVVLMRYAFEDLGLHRVEFSIIPGNQPSHRVMEKIGVRREAVVERYFHANGGWQDCVRYAMTSEEWHLDRQRLVRTWLVSPLLSGEIPNVPFR